METKAQKIFYMLSGFLLMSGLFVMQPNQSLEVSSLQNEIKHEFSIAWQQTIGDQSFFEGPLTVIEAVNEFYNEAADATIALLQDRTGSDQDLVYVAQTMYYDFKLSFSKPETTKVAQIPEPPIDLAHFMNETAITNIVPEPIIAGAVFSPNPVNQPNQWVTIQDNFTGQLYCLALYNGETNKYLGPCKNDYH